MCPLTSPEEPPLLFPGRDLDGEGGGGLFDPPFDGGGGGWFDPPLDAPDDDPPLDSSGRGLNGRTPLLGG